MPLLGQPDTSIYGQTQLWNAPGLAPQGRAGGGPSGPTAAQMRFGADQQVEEDINALAQQYGDDYDGLVKAVTSKHPDRGLAMGKALEEYRQNAAKTDVENNKVAVSKIDLGTRWLQEAIEDPSKYPVVRARAVSAGGQAIDQILPAPDDPDLQNKLVGVVSAAQPTKDYLETRTKAMQSYMDGNKVDGTLTLLAGSKTPAQWDASTKIVKMGGMGQLLQGIPDAASAQQMLADRQALKPEKAESAGSDLKQYFTKWAGEHGKTYDQMTTADVDAANTQREKTMRKPVVAGGGRSGVGGPELVIKPNTRDYRIATDVASGRLPYGDFQRMFGRGAQFAEKKAAMYDTARQINPDFDVAAFEMGQKVAGNPKIVMQVSSLNNVMSGVPDLLKASDAASNAGVRLLNSYITKGGFVVGGKPYTNLKVARTAFADELSGALGYGSATDMSREMGFNMADDSLPPDKFADAIQSIVVPFVERKKASILGGMGEYGKPGRSPASTAPAGSGKFTVTDPNGKVHPFDTQAQADAFKKLMQAASQ